MPGSGVIGSAIGWAMASRALLSDLAMGLVIALSRLPVLIGASHWWRALAR